jgi:integrase
MKTNPTTRKQKDETDAWPFVRWIESRQRWQVDSRTAKGGERKFYKTKAEATGAATAARMRLSNEGLGGFDNSELKRYGKTVTDAINFYLAHLRRESESVAISEAITTFINHKRPSVRHKRLQHIESRLEKLRNAVGADTRICHVESSAIVDFLNAIPHSVTRNDYRKEIVMLWRFAKGKGWVTTTIDKTLVPRAKEAAYARTILSVEQVAALMRHSVADDVRALNALVLFAGCRREEVEKMDWSHIEFDNGHINITPEISKVDTERFAPINDTLRAWLQPIAKKSGPIISRVMDKALQKTWKAAGLYPWPQDAHRHSFISYRRTQVGDAITALEAGTSEAIIKKHYKRPVSKDAAENFFAIRPEMDGKVIPITAAA